MVERDIGRLKKNDETDIVVRIDDFGGKVGLTIREFVQSDRYTGFTKAGVRIRADDFAKFKEMINSIDEKELENATPEQETLPTESPEKKETSNENSGVSEDGLM